MHYFFLFFSANDVEKRRKFVTLVDSVRDNGGDVRIFSSLHVSGERKYNVFSHSINEVRVLMNKTFSTSTFLMYVLKHFFLYVSELGQLSGLAAILRFPIPDPEESDDSSEGDEE